MCPKCKKKLEKALFHNVEVDYCASCLGLWFEEEELRWAKDEKDKDLCWLDIDLWQDKSKFKIVKGIRACPCCRVPLYEVYYGRSPIIVDVCGLCRGIWLDRGEFHKIIECLKEEGEYKLAKEKMALLFKQGQQIFIGPDPIKEELLDFVTVIKLLLYRFLVRHQNIKEAILSLRR